MQGRTALICAGSRGIGAACAKMLAGMGARVVVMSRSREKLDSLAAQLPGKHHQTVAVDLSETDSALAACDALLDSIGSVHVLVNNMAGPKAGALLDADDDAFLSGLRNHVLLAHGIVKRVLPGMRDSGYGRIVNIISTSVKVPIAGLGVSNTIRGAMANWAKTLSLELAVEGITVNNVLPGFTDTDRLADLVKGRAQSSGKDPDQIRRAIAASVPMARIGDADEVAAAVSFLASPAASYITGINIPVDGGRTGCL